MPTDPKADPRAGFVPRYLPWLLAGAVFCLYCLTLDRQISLFNSSLVARVCGWDWRPQISAPLTFLATVPFHFLPAAAIPAALNLFAAVCAALTIGLLARSVALLPQDRTEAQRHREKSDHSFFTGPMSWLPPALAAAVCGLQLTFWEHATNFSGELFDLLLFAFVIWSLLEYRLDKREGRLFLAAFVYGAAMPENWAMVGFSPLFLAAIIWVRGRAIFDLRFIGRMIMCGAAGLLFYLLLPLVAVTSSNMPVTFWEVLKYNLMPARAVIKDIGDCIFQPGQYSQYDVLALVYLMPVLVMAIRWKASFGDTSRIGSAFASFFFHVAHAVFLGIFIWMAFDPQFSPRSLGGGKPFLTFYYLGALAIGYYSGYFLVIFGKQEVGKRRARKTPPLQFLNKPIVAGVWLLAAVSVAGLFYRNLPLLRGGNSDALHQYAKLIERNLPSDGGYLLSDDPERLMMVRAALAQDGRENEFVPLETDSLTIPAYHHYLHRHYGQRWPDLVGSETNSLNPAWLVQFLSVLSRTNDLYYLHPSFGYYFEQFYLEPHGLVYKMKRLPRDTLRPPQPDGPLIAENENFWTHEAAPALAGVERAIAPPDPSAPASWPEYLLMRLHISPQPDNKAETLAGAYYSRDLDFWAVDLQSAGELKPAATDFEAALQLNPDNAIAKINLDFNEKIQAGEPATMDLSQVSIDRFGKYTTWDEALNADGPLDDPNFCFVYGTGLVRDMGYYRQSIEEFEQVHQFVPDYLPARLMLAQDYLVNHNPQRAMNLLREPLDDPAKFSLNETNEAEIHTLAAAVYFQETNFNRGIQLLKEEIARHPDDNALLIATAQVFMMHGLFTNALQLIDQRLQSTPDNPAWLYNRGYVNLQMKDYPAAAAAFDRVLKIQTNNLDALFFRALANRLSGRLDAAHADYSRLQLAYSNSPAVAYGLAEVAWRQHDTNEAIRNYQIYLAHARTNTDEAKTVAERLKSLEH